MEAVFHEGCQNTNQCDNNYHGKQAKYKHIKPISCASLPNSTWTQLQEGRQ